MKKLILFICLAFTVSAYAGGDHTLKNDNGSVKMTVDSGVGISISKDGDTAVDVLDADDVGDMVQAHSDNLDEWAVTNPTTNAKARAGMSDTELQIQLKAGKVVQDLETLDVDDTLTADVGYLIHTPIAGNSNPTHFLFAESGNELAGAIWAVENTTTNEVTTEDITDVADLKGTLSLGIGEQVWLMRNTSNTEWVELFRTSDINIGDINNIPGTIQGGKKFYTGSGEIDVTDVDDAGTSLLGGTIFHSAAGNDKIPAGYNITGSGYRCQKWGTFDVTSYSEDGSVVHYLMNGDTTGNSGADAFKLADANGSWADIYFTSSTVLRVIDENGTTVGAGSAGSSCTAYDQYDTTSDAGLTIAYAVTRDRVGTTITPDDAFTLCRADFYAYSITGDISSIDYFAEIWTLTGTTLNAKQGVSDELDGGDISSSAEITFEFSSPVSLTGSTEYAILIKSVADGEGADASPDYSSTNYFRVGYKNEAMVGDMDASKVATGGTREWQDSDKTQTDTDADDDVYLRVFD